MFCPPERPERNKVYPAAYSTVLGHISRGVKRPGPEADHSSRYLIHDAESVLGSYDSQKICRYARSPARCLSLGSARSHSPSPHPPCVLKLLFNIFCNLRIGFPSSPFPSGFANITPQTPVLSPLRATCLSHPILLDLIIRTVLEEECRSFPPDSSLCSTEVHNAWNCSTIPLLHTPFFFFAWFLMQNRGKRTFLCFFYSEKFCRTRSIC